jgi:hypothetical protein
MAMRKIIPLLIGTVLLVSCVDVQTQLSLRGDGSGTLVLAYSISRQLADLGRTGADLPAVPLPVEREDFQRALGGVPGLSLKSFTRAQNELEVSIRAEIGFSSLEALAGVEAFKEMQVRVETAGSRHTLSVLLARAAEGPVTEDSLAMVDEMFQGRMLTYVVHAPAPIISSSANAQVSADRRTLTYAARMRDLVSLSEDLVLSVTW